MSEINIILIIAGILLVLFIIREFWTWYFKLNKLVTNQDKQIAILQKILVSLRPHGQIKKK